MANSYYTPPADVAALTRARSGDINLRDDAVDAAFDKVPDEAKLKRGTVNYAVTAGTADAYTVTLPYVPSGYVDGLLVNAYIHATNTGAATVNVNSLGVKSVKLQGGGAPLAGDLQKFVDMRYSTTTGFFHVQGNTAGSVADAAASAAAAAASASAASSSASSASSSAASAAASYDSFDDRYLGPKASDPTLDNDGNALLIGALYFNTTSNIMRIYTDSGWLASTASAVNVAFTPAATIAATNVQAAIEEIVSDLAASSGAGLIGRISTGTGATASTVQDKLREIVSVEDYFVIGMTDYKSAFDDALATNPGGIKFADNKTYTCSPITVDRKVKIFSERGAIVKLANNANSALFTISASDVSICGLELDGNRANNSGASYGINTLHGTARIDIRHNRIRDFYQEGVRIQGGEDIRIYSNRIENCEQPANESAVVVRNELGSSRGIYIVANTIDQRASSNGCIKIQSAHANYSATDVYVLGNTCLLGDPTTSEALGIELFTAADGSITNSIVGDNTIECTGTATVSGNPSNYYAYGISIGGGSSTVGGYGIEGCSVVANTIKNCRRIGLELIGRYISAQGNTLVSCAEISINSDLVAGGMYGVVVTNNTQYNTGGSGLFYGGIRLRAILNSMTGTVVLGNIMHKVSGATSTEDMIWIQGGNGIGSNIGEFFDISIHSNDLDNVFRNGIHIQSDTKADNISILGNNIRYASTATSGTGILNNARSLNNLLVSSNSIKAISGNTIDGIVLNGLTNATDVKVLNNTTKYTRNGVYTSDNCDGLSVSDNTNSNASGIGITILGSPTLVRYHGNLFVSCATNESISTTTSYFAELQSLFGFKPGATKTIAAGVITITMSRHLVDTEASAATDDLDTINGGSADGQILLLTSANSARAVTAKDTTGNLRLAGDFILNHVQDTLLLMWNGAQWIEISRSDNS